jgi:putative iron-regulated protein
MRIAARALSIITLSLGLALPAISGQAPQGPSAAAVITGYADTAHAMYSDSLVAARAMQTEINAFLGAPAAASLNRARTAWRAARIPYQQTEGLRFGNAMVDDWEPKVNAWPLDEGLIDYVAPSYGTTSDANPLYTLNVIARPQIRIGPRTIDATNIDADLLRILQGANGVEANVATGYHAIEFLLWGQDLNGTGPGAGRRPHTDYDLRACTGGNCARRAAYLRAATELLISDLEEMVAAWAPDGEARTALIAKGEEGALSTILTGLGSLSYGELAGERMKLGMILQDPEEEHDCFSDNTHNSHFYDQLGMVALWDAVYRRPNGETVRGASLRAYTRARDPAAAERVDAAMREAYARLRLIKQSADSGRMAYDQMLAPGNAEGQKMLQDAIDGLVAQTRALEAVVATLGLMISVSGSDSLDNPTAVQ